MFIDGLATFQGLLLLAIGLLVLVAAGFSLIDALRRRADAFTAAGKLTKPIWCIILGIATAIALIMVNTNPLNFLNVLAAVASGVYLADVRPAVRGYSGGGNAGPYGRW